MIQMKLHRKSSAYCDFLMLTQRLRRRLNIEPTLGQSLESAGRHKK